MHTATINKLSKPYRPYKRLNRRFSPTSAALPVAASETGRAPKRPRTPGASLFRDLGFGVVFIVPWGFVTATCDLGFTVLGL